MMNHPGLMENHKIVPKCDLFVHAHKFSLSLTKPQLTSNDLPPKEKYWAADSTVKKIPGLLWKAESVEIKTNKEMKTINSTANYAKIIVGIH